MFKDLEPLLSAVSAESPSGSDLEYDNDFSRMEKAATGTPDQEFGSTKIEGTVADWQEVQSAARSVLLRSKDLRAATYLARAELAMRGLLGLRDALQIISVFVLEFWDTVYPQLDADDDNDPTSRINALAGLSNVGGLIRELRTVPILTSRSVGRFSWTDCAMAKGEIPTPEDLEVVPTQKKIDAAVLSCDPQELSLLGEAVEESIKFAASIEDGFSDKLGPAVGPNLELLTKDLRGISKFYKSWIALRNDGASSGDAFESDSEEDSTSESGGNDQVRQKGVSGPFVIGRREDAIEALDKIIRWFEANEPTSPAPMLLKRAKRLSTMSFIDILKELSPDGVTQATLIVGQEKEEPEPPKPSQASSAKNTPSKTQSKNQSGRPAPKDDEY